MRIFFNRALALETVVEAAKARRDDLRHMSSTDRNKGADETAMMIDRAIIYLERRP